MTYRSSGINVPILQLMHHFGNSPHLLSASPPSPHPSILHHCQAPDLLREHLRHDRIREARQMWIHLLTTPELLRSCCLKPQIWYVDQIWSWALRF